MLVALSPQREFSMPAPVVAIIIGSLRKDSFNRQLAGAVQRLAGDRFAFRVLEIGDLPLYNQDDDGSQAPEVQRFKSELRAVDAVMFVTPEYNRSIPGVLKNALDNASRPYGQNAWAGKPAGVLGASIGSGGSAMAQQHLRNVLAYLDVPTLGQPEVFIHVKEGFFDQAGKLAKPESKAFLQTWMDRYVAWVKKHAA
jgi:chromate reductase